ncbi:hypothetical protein KUCAC02_025098 [Chaenocephalus aceratus]|nr:hypothetical protein KUCAC02_037137 [Chaenocephalus aceratus]KAI4797369.1 hypothetical protein KUCAC02_025098 [Chaenocephalus aceratus]
MVDHNDYYSNYRWVTEKDDWLVIALLATPLMIVFGIAHRLWTTRASSHIYTPCSRFHAIEYGPVCLPATCALEEPGVGVNQEHAKQDLRANRCSVI